jgi:hypothetical protein
MRIRNRKSCQSVVSAHSYPHVFFRPYLTFNSLCYLIFSVFAGGNCPPGVHLREESPRNRTTVCGSIPNFSGHPSLAVKSRLTLPYVELGERAGASLVVKWCRIRIVSGLFLNDGPSGN